MPQLRSLLCAHPLSERLYGQLMRALHAGGRPAEALTVYEDAPRALADGTRRRSVPELSAPHLELLQGQDSPAPRRPRLPVQLTRGQRRSANGRRTVSGGLEAAGHDEDTRPRPPTVLISGASVAGPALALNLADGARVTVVEKAVDLREGGFAVDFRGHVHRTC